MTATPDEAVTVHSVTLTFEVRDPALAGGLAKDAFDWAHEMYGVDANVDFDLATSRYVEGQMSVPDSMVDELAERVRAKLAALAPSDDHVVFDAIELGRAAYEAYARSTGGLTYDKRQMPAWEDLGDEIRSAWADAARESAIAYQRAALGV